MAKARSSDDLIFADPLVVESFKQKLAYQLKKRRWKNADLAREMDVSATAVGNWVKHGSISKVNAVTVARIFGTSISYFLNSDIPLEQDSADVEMTVATARGTQETVVQIRDYHLARGETAGSRQSSSPVLSMMVRKSWLEQYLPSPDMYPHVYIYTVRTNTMSSTLEVGDVVFVDTTVRLAESSGLYLVQIHESEDIRRIQLNPDGSMVIRCDNSSYDDFMVPPDPKAKASVKILGSVLPAFAIRKI